LSTGGRAILEDDQDRLRHARLKSPDPDLPHGGRPAAAEPLEYEYAHGEFAYKITYLTGKAMAADLVKVAVDPEEKEARNISGLLWKWFG
jgi:hypothetical protein